jgi:excisionase family DNA binding protein
MTTAASDHLVLTVEEAAERLGVGRTMMYALVKSGAIESMHRSTAGIPEDAVETFVRGLRDASVLRNTNPNRGEHPHQDPGPGVTSKSSAQGRSRHSHPPTIPIRPRVNRS